MKVVPRPPEPEPEPEKPSDMIVMGTLVGEEFDHTLRLSEYMVAEHNRKAF